MRRRSIATVVAFAAALAIAGFTAVSVLASTASPPPPDLGNLLVADPDLENGVRKIVTEVHDFSADGQAVTQIDIDHFRMVQRSRLRAMVLSQLLAGDLDGDGKITRDEVETLWSYDHRHLSGDVARRMKYDVDQTMQGDTDHDGVMSLAEMLAMADLHVTKFILSQRPGPAAIILFALDPNHDGRLDLAETEAIVRQGYAGLDLDGDGKISQGENTAYRSRIGANPSAVPKP